jgi:hypothetical protein
MARFHDSAMVGLFIGLAFAAYGDGDLGPEKLSLLQDSGGWEYLSMDNIPNGFPTNHVCFDGQPHPDICSGTLTLSKDNNFTQTTNIGQQSLSRQGTYQLTGSQLTFFDETGNKDGPFVINIDPDKKLMTMDAPPLKIKLQLYKEYKKQLEEKNKNKKK